MPIFVYNNNQLELRYVYVYSRHGPSNSTWTPLLSISKGQFILLMQRGLICRCSPTKLPKQLYCQHAVFLKYETIVCHNTYCAFNFLINNNHHCQPLHIKCTRSPEWKLGFRCIIYINLSSWSNISSISTHFNTSCVVEKRRAISRTLNTTN